MQTMAHVPKKTDDYRACHNSSQQRGTLGGTCNGGGAGQDCEDGRVCMVEAHSVHRAKLGEVVFVGDVVAVPSHNIEGGVRLARPE